MTRERDERPGPRDRAHIRPTAGPTPGSAYRSPVDAVILAGNTANPRHRVGGGNKAFLPLEGRPMVAWVVDALLRASSVDRIFVVGPVDALERAVGGLSSRVHIVAQAGKMIRNAWEGFHASDRLRAGFHQEPDPDRPALFLSCDIPLITPVAVDDFVARCAEEDRKSEGSLAALLVGVAEEASLTSFYSTADRPGIMRPYVELSSGRYRLANIYLCRPGRMAHREILQAGFSQRKARYIGNALGLAWTFFRKPGGWRGAWLVATLQLARLFSRWPGRLYRALRRRNTIERIESVGSFLLGGALRVVTTPFGGLSIDVDDEEDYRVLRERFREWSATDDAATGARPA
jgi:CTP:molybdopterin cytidylyltransferase MocA